MSYLERMRPAPGQRVLVTAGASGIGAATARAFLEAGARVAICDVDKAALDAFAAEHPEVITIVADVSDTAAVAAMIATVAESFGALDVLVNNAGIAGPTGRVEDLDLGDIRRTLDVDILGQFIVLQGAIPLLRKGTDALILNVASVAGRLGYPLRTPYAAAKWGIVGLTASLAKEIGPDGIRVNAILPGPVRGPRMDRVMQDRATAEGRSFDEVQDEYLRIISLRRMVGPEDIASMALFLASPAASGIAGQALSVCGNVETL
ncbi:SDR family oxidoreductase [Oceanicola sp. 502str15]|uniref:SDR family oxidoreductase n=1 Tax=Oceanicola sp. 502str15 TaxID=2696061 RepID=UPI002095EE68|nr:SDR family oxidoreductase [Oceanicola sp. 502str15]MCO6384881.1 SDR family oxidoreductase [Oceanicola sp. 502str15]